MTRTRDDHSAVRLLYPQHRKCLDGAGMAESGQERTLTCYGLMAARFSKDIFFI